MLTVVVDRQKFPLATVSGCGQSLGSVMGLNYVTETGAACPAEGFLAISGVPDFAKSAEEVSKGPLVTQLFDVILGSQYKPMLKKVRLFANLT